MGEPCPPTPPAALKSEPDTVRIEDVPPFTPFVLDAPPEPPLPTFNVNEPLLVIETLVAEITWPPPPPPPPPSDPV